jgi:hypothetical protein
MCDLWKLIWYAFARLSRSRASLEAEILVLRHQLNVLRRKSPQRITFSAFDRMVFAGLYALVPSILDVLKIVKPDTVIRWHRAGFRAYWRWKSRARGGRPSIPAEIRQLIREMSIANPLWGAPRIPRRIAQARHRGRANHGGKIHGQAAAAKGATGQYRRETQLRHSLLDFGATQHGQRVAIPT